MSNVTEPTPQSPSPPAAPDDRLAVLVRHRQTSGYVLFAVAIALVLLAIWAGMRATHVESPATTEPQVARAPLPVTVRGDYAVLCVAAALLAAVMLGAGGFQLLFPYTSENERGTARLFVVALGSLTGLVITFLGIGLLPTAWKPGAFPTTWWDTLLGGWAVWQGPEGWRVWVVLGAFFGGLIVTFVSLQPARAIERSNVTLRRLLYGFNAVFTALLLIAILTGINLLVYVPWGPFEFLGKDYAWSAQSTYSLSPQSETALKALKKETRVYAIISQNDQFYFPLLALLEQCKSVVNDDKLFQFEFLSPDRDRERVATLSADYKIDEDRTGILVLYGDGPAKESRFIKREEMFDHSDARATTTYFRGEQALVNEFVLLEEGKARPIIYFTQGNGELDVNDRAPARQWNQGAGDLKRELETVHYEVKALQFERIAGRSPDPLVTYATEVPADASVVVIAGPRQPLPDYALKALRKYLKKNGKLIVFLDVVVGPDRKTMVKTGLEALLAEYNVEVGDNRIMHAVSNRSQDPTALLVAPPQSRNPDDDSLTAKLATSLRGNPVLMFDARTVGPPAQMSSDLTFFPRVLLETSKSGLYVWAEKDVATDPWVIVARLSPEEMATRRAQGPLPVAVTVTEMATGNPHAPIQKAGEPRLAVFGDVSIISNAYLNERSAVRPAGMAVFDAVLSWLSKRKPRIVIESKRPDFFVLRQDASSFALYGIPGLLAVVSIVSLGAGVWVVRRR